MTGGQYLGQAPLHFDAVEASRANQYKVKPLALVSTRAPPIFADVSVAPEAACDDFAAGEEFAALDELP